MFLECESLQVRSVPDPPWAGRQAAIACCAPGAVEDVFPLNEKGATPPHGLLLTTVASRRSTVSRSMSHVLSYGAAPAARGLPREPRRVAPVDRGRRDRPRDVVRRPHEPGREHAAAAGGRAVPHQRDGDGRRHGCAPRGGRSAAGASKQARRRRLPTSPSRSGSSGPTSSTASTPKTSSRARDRSSTSSAGRGRHGRYRPTTSRDVRLLEKAARRLVRWQQARPRLPAFCGSNGMPRCGSWSGTACRSSAKGA